VVEDKNLARMDTHGDNEGEGDLEVEAEHQAHHKREGDLDPGCKEEDMLDRQVRVDSGVRACDSQQRRVCGAPEVAADAATCQIPCVALVWAVPCCLESRSPLGEEAFLPHP